MKKNISVYLLPIFLSLAFSEVFAGPEDLPAVPALQISQPVKRGCVGQLLHMSYLTLRTPDRTLRWMLTTKKGLATTVLTGAIVLPIYPTSTGYTSPAAKTFHRVRGSMSAYGDNQAQVDTWRAFNNTQANGPNLSDRADAIRITAEKDMADFKPVDSNFPSIPQDKNGVLP